MQWFVVILAQANLAHTREVGIEAVGGISAVGGGPSIIATPIWSKGPSFIMTPSFALADFDNSPGHPQIYHRGFWCPIFAKL